MRLCSCSRNSGVLGRMRLRRAMTSCTLPGHTMAVEVGKAAQGIAVINAFAQLAIVRVLDAHQDEGAQGLRGGDAAASGVGVLQSARQILAHLLDQRAW